MGKIPDRGLLLGRWTLRGAVVRFHRPGSIDSSRGQGGCPGRNLR